MTTETKTETTTPFMTKAEFDAAIGGHFLIEKKVEALAEQYINKFCGAKESIESIHFDEEDAEAGDGGTISFTTYAYYCGCCGPDHEYYTIPLSYLWDEDWEEQEKATREAKKLAKEKQKAEEKAKEEEERQKKRYEQFLKMKDEYEGDATND